jgi:hypothetical protein
VFDGKVKLMPAMNRQPPTFTALVPGLCSSTNWSSSSREMGWYMISLMTMALRPKAELVVPGVGAASARNVGAPSGERPRNAGLARSTASSTRVGGIAEEDRFAVRTSAN